jgi:hypothetical protein
MKRASLVATLGALALACGPSSSKPPEPGTIAFEPERPTPGGATPAAVYTGTDPDVLAAQATYPRGTDLHLKLVLRTCSGTNGVCHNQKEYPDLHTQGTFLSAIGAPCNVQSGNPTGVYDRCERLGDRFRFAEQEFNKIEIGWFTLVPGASPKLDPKGARPEDDTAGLHLYLHDPVPGSDERLYVTGTFIRNFVDAADEVQELAFASYKTNWWVFPDRRHLFAEVSEGQRDAVEGLVASGIVQGDQNHNGVYGARLAVPVPLLNPGKPEESYLVARLRGAMKGEAIPGTRMPLANQPPSVPDMLALMCFIEGLDPKARTWSLESAIDYTRCSYSARPQALNLAGEGATWSGGVLPILQSNCGGCHGGDSPQGGLNLLGSPQEVYARLTRPSAQNPSLALIEKGVPLKSYLWLKISGDGPISGSRMPLNPLNGTASLPADQLKKIEDWISFGASDN